MTNPDSKMILATRLERALAVWKLNFRLLVGALSHSKVDLIAVIAFGFIGGFAQVGAIGALLGFLRMMSKSEAGGDLAWHGLHLHNDIWGLLVASAILAVMLIVATTASYFSARRARAIGRACTERGVVRLIQLIDQAKTLPPDVEPDALRAMGVRGTRLYGIAVENVVKLIQPASQFCVLFGGMWWINKEATLLLIPALFVPLPFLWKFNSSVRDSARLFYDSAAVGFGKAVGQAIDSMQQVRVQSETLGHGIISTYEKTQVVQDFFQAFDVMQLTANRAMLITGLFRPLILVYVLLLLGMGVNSGGMRWPDAIAFIVLLNQLTTRAEGLVSHISVLSRLFTQVEPIKRFEDHITHEASLPEPEDDGKWPTIRAGANAVSVAPGERVQIYTGRHHVRLTLAKLWKALEPHTAEGHIALQRCAFIGSRHRPHGATGIQIATGQQQPTEEQISRINALAAELGATDAFDAVRDINIDHAQWDLMPASVRAILQLGPALADPCRVLAVDLAVVNQLTKPEADCLFAHFSDRAMVILAPQYRSGSAYATSVVVIEDDKTEWVGTPEEWRNSAARIRLIEIGSENKADALEEEMELESELE